MALILGGLRDSNSGQQMDAAHKLADMKPDDAGTWLFHCHVNDHIIAGMQALYTVTA